ncbi:MAG: hypothetical protein II237_06540, partial [Clostridia bacterium]|nr:hypothetical protein [Clostridia bacterium]
MSEYLITAETLSSTILYASPPLILLLPYYSSVIYQFDHGDLKGKGNKVAYFLQGGVYDSLEIPTTYEGHIFAGWKITRVNGNKTDIGGMVSVGSPVGAYRDDGSLVGYNVEMTA